MACFYNDIDPFVCAWTRELIADGLIPEGKVDERPIQEIEPDDLMGYRWCSFFNGIAGWPYALDLAGFSRELEVWTASCPCQPFSVAGKQQGNDDKRHLWPEFMRLVRVCKPPLIFGEQVASSLVIGKVGGKAEKDAGPVWVDGIQADLEAEGYTFGACVLGAHSVSAPHIRQRLFWVAYSELRRPEQRNQEQRKVSVLDANSPSSGVADSMPTGRTQGRTEPGRGQASECGTSSGMENSPCIGRRGGGDGDQTGNDWSLQTEGHGPSGADAGDCGVGHCIGKGLEVGSRKCENTGTSETARSSTQLYGAWLNSRFIPCADGKWRRVPEQWDEAQSGVFRLDDGLPCIVSGGGEQGGEIVEVSTFPLSPKEAYNWSRVGLLKGFGNAIVPQIAAEFIKAFMELTHTT